MSYVCSRCTGLSKLSGTLEFFANHVLHGEARVEIKQKVRQNDPWDPLDDFKPSFAKIRCLSASELCFEENHLLKTGFSRTKIFVHGADRGL